jgi:hypothetical protein
MDMEKIKKDKKNFLGKLDYHCSRLMPDKMAFPIPVQASKCFKNPN